ncbi:hypothetical protein E2C01_048803 [Portunus trituberculatus]|uniref:Uncharacterized protein n=1 Tax=Portunus trituberculatus TaxID=210409 RepID=A0A5B7GEC9_PORTR|nr:hypothetical protein [Portunus trituberculatus]
MDNVEEEGRRVGRRREVIRGGITIHENVWCDSSEPISGGLWLTNACTLTRFLIFTINKPLWCNYKYLNEKLPTECRRILFSQDCGTTMDAHWYPYYQ